MIQLEDLISIYETQRLDEVELAYLQVIKKSDDWLKKTDHQKQAHRKSYLNKLETFFNDREDFEYQKQAINTTDFILDFLRTVSFQDIDFDRSSETEQYLFRLYNLVWCEKEILFQREGLNLVRHIPFDVFEPLITKVASTEHYRAYKLGVLFEEYKKMLELSESLPRG